MDTFIPFIHQPKPKKKEEQVPLYIELEPPPAREPEKKEENAPGVVIIELW